MPKTLYLNQFFDPGTGEHRHLYLRSRVGAQNERLACKLNWWQAANLVPVVCFKITLKPGFEDLYEQPMPFETPPDPEYEVPRLVRVQASV